MMFVKLILLFLLQIGVVFFGVAQTANAEPEKKIRFTVLAMAGRSIFAANALASQSRFPTDEIRLGGTFIKPLYKNLDLISGFMVGSKLKGERVFPPGSTPPGVTFKISPPFSRLEEAVNSRNHYFYEVPLLLQVRLFKNRIGLRSGGNFRNFSGNSGYFDSSGLINYGPDFFSHRKEFGILTGLSLKLSERLLLNGIYFRGLTIFDAGFFSQLNSLTNFSYIIKNRFWQIGLEYKL